MSLATRNCASTKSAEAGIAEWTAAAGDRTAELPKVELSPDPDDNPLLATAIAGMADFLVTGDKRDVLSLGKWRRSDCHRPHLRRSHRGFRHRLSIPRRDTGLAVRYSTAPAARIRPADWPGVD